MNHPPLVSCIIIFFNAEAFFAEAIESILAQTYDRWELLLADDGSHDGSTAIAQDYARRYPDQIRYLEHDQHQNCGMSATRNLGLRHAKGEYIAFLDADDVWLPNKLARQVELLQTQPEAAMVYGRSLYWRSWDRNTTDEDYIPAAYLPANLYQPPSLLIQSYPLGGATPPPPTDILLRRDAIEQLGGFEAGFRGIYQLYEDQAFFAKLHLQFPVLVSDECWDKYRLHDQSCGSVVNRSGQYHKVRQFFLNWLEQYLRDRNVQNFELQTALDQALWPYRHPILHRLKKRAGGLVRKFKALIALPFSGTFQQN